MTTTDDGHDHVLDGLVRAINARRGEPIGRVVTGFIIFAAYTDADGKNEAWIDWQDDQTPFMTSGLLRAATLSTEDELMDYRGDGEDD